MRTITDHIINPANERLTITVEDEPRQGGASYRYKISGFSSENMATLYTKIIFQHGPIKECGTNGVTDEALLAICIDRLRAFQTGPFHCNENAIAMLHLENALLCLAERAKDRIQRGVYDTHTP